MAPGPLEGTHITTTHSTVTSKSHHTKNTPVTSHTAPKITRSAHTQSHTLVTSSTVPRHHHILPRVKYEPSLILVLWLCNLTHHKTHNDAFHSLFSASWSWVEAGQNSFPSLSRFPRPLNPYLKSLLPEVLGPQHSESSCANESRPLAQRGGLRFTVSYQSHHPAIHTDCHTVPPARGHSQSGGGFSPHFSLDPNLPYTHLPSMRLTCWGRGLKESPRRPRAGPRARPSCRAPPSS